MWQAAQRIPADELWATRHRQRSELVEFVRARSVADRLGRGDLRGYVDAAARAFDPEVLTIGFARRVATYKRLDLLIRDPDWTLALLAGERPVQVVLAGKAHPRDEEAKRVLQSLFGLKAAKVIGERVVFLDDYDLHSAARLVRGCDVWLNVPRPPLEASGTSGMKSAANGGLNLSILDGWWCEGYDGQNGFAIGAGEEYTDLTYQDDVESRAIYDLLEQEITPLFYTRSSDGLPRGWLRMMKHSITTLCPVFNTGRMVAEYMTTCYEPSARRFLRLTGDNLKRAAELAAWRRDLTRGWTRVKIVGVESSGTDPMHVGADLGVKVRVDLGGLKPDDVEVQLFHGLVDSVGEIPQPQTVRMSHNGAHDGSTWVFSGAIPCSSSGQHGFAVRILPQNADLANSFEPGLVTWG
jgi:starch phosphorylase